IQKKKPLLALVVIVAALAITVLENDYSVFTVSTLIQKPGENIIVNFTVPEPARELIFAAHYDSKNDVWDHLERTKILKMLPYALLVAIISCIWVLFEKKFRIMGRGVLKFVPIVLPGVFVVYGCFLFSWLGGYVFLGEDRQSYGAIDDAASVVTLMGMARDINSGKTRLGDSNVTLLITGGEEVGYQGAYAYIKKRFGDKPANPKIPVSLVNLELVAQNGNMVYWKTVGSLTKFYQADPSLIKRLNTVWLEASGKPMDSGGTLTDDTMVFGAVGIPFVTVGHSGIPGLGFGGFHSPADNMDRVNPENLALMIKTLEKYIESYGKN
ncbi:Zn-dependent exopeptidase M28, partial [bacterium]|nr:Zn-dependent exopeptidase M28 [bacterium]